MLSVKNKKPSWNVAALEVLLTRVTPSFHLHIWGHDLEVVDVLDDVDVAQPIQRCHLRCNLGSGFQLTLRVSLNLEAFNLWAHLCRTSIAQGQGAPFARVRGFEVDGGMFQS